MKKLLLFSILFLPTSIWVFLELSTINIKKLPHYGPKKTSGIDTVFYTVNSTFKTVSNSEKNVNAMQRITLDTIQFPVYVVSFIKQSYKSDSYRLAGLSEYLQFKKEKIAEIPFVIVSECDGINNENCFREFELLHTKLPNIHNMFWDTRSFDSINKTYFFKKPIYIDYSFFALIDSKRNIRGYYDARYISEVKRLIEEYQHLRLKHEKKNLMNQNKIENK